MQLNDTNRLPIASNTKGKNEPQHHQLGIIISTIYIYIYIYIYIFIVYIIRL